MQQPLRQVVVDRQPAVLDVAHQRIPAVQCILQRLAERRLARQPAPLLQHPRVQRLQQRLALRLAHRAALLGRLAVDRRLDGIELADPPQRLFSDRRLGALVDLEQFAPRMRHAGDMGDRRRFAALRRGERPCCMDQWEGRTHPYPVRGHAMRTDSGRPNSSMRFSAWTATPTSVARRWSVRQRSPSPITCLNLPMVASTRARMLYPEVFCHPMRPTSAIACRCWSRCVGAVAAVSLGTALERGGTMTDASGWRAATPLYTP